MLVLEGGRWPAVEAALAAALLVDTDGLAGIEVEAAWATAVVVLNAAVGCGAREWTRAARRAATSFKSDPDLFSEGRDVRVTPDVGVDAAAVLLDVRFDDARFSARGVLVGAVAAAGGAAALTGGWMFAFT